MRDYFSVFIIILLISPSAYAAPKCTRTPLSVDGFSGFKIGDGSLIGWGRNHVNVDGMRNAYHRDGRPGGALISICNAGTAYMPDGGIYTGLKNHCHEMFSVYSKNLASGRWDDPKVGAINWYGIVGRGNTKIAGNTVENYIPVEQADGSGFFVSPTALFDGSYDEFDQRRYVDAEVVSYATISKGVLKEGVKQGQFGVAYRPKTGRIVPFVIADAGPRVGEGSFALGRELAGLPPVKATSENVNDANMEDGVLWVLFGAQQGLAKPPYSAGEMRQSAKAAYDSWGGERRLKECMPPVSE